MPLIGSLPLLSDVGWGWGHHSWLWGGVMMIGWWVLVVAVVVIVVRALGQQGRSAPISGAEQVLSERYARGEIDEQEFRARLSVLKEDR